MTPSQKSRMKKKIEKWNTNNSNCTDIIVWGSKLDSGLGGPLKLEGHVPMLYSLPPYINSVIIGLLLGDGWLHIDKSNRSKNARFGFKQGLINIKFILFVFNFCLHFVGLCPF